MEESFIVSIKLCGKSLSSSCGILIFVRFDSLHLIALIYLGFECLHGSKERPQAKHLEGAEREAQRQPHVHDCRPVPGLQPPDRSEVPSGDVFGGQQDSGGLLEKVLGYIPLPEVLRWATRCE